MITTYQRPRQLEKLTKKLKKLNPECVIVVISDELNYTFNTENIDVLLCNKQNQGKAGWWRTVNALWDKALEVNADYYIQMVDDSLPNDNFFTELFRIWDTIQDDKKIALHLANNGREMNWTNFKRRRYNKDVYLTQTTEMSFLCLPEFITYRIPYMNPDRWIKNPLSGSGVGNRLNKHWVAMGRRIYGVVHSIISKNEGAGSLMNPKERQINPWKIL